MFPVGPVTGTAFNITMLSYNNICQFGIHLDPAAVTDRELLVKSIGLSFRELGVAPDVIRPASAIVGYGSIANSVRDY